MPHRLGYLSGALRVSTDPQAEAGGPRSHVIGVMQAFETIGWEIKPFIVGDRVPREWVKKSPEKTVSSGYFRTLAADLVRLFLSVKNSRQAWQELGGQVDWVYERFACFQSLGKVFQQHQIPWILETSGPFFYEAKSERKSLVLTGLERQLELRAYREADAIICVSEALKDILVQEANISPEKIVIVPNGVDTNFFDPARYEPKQSSQNFTIGFVGALLRWQGLDILLEALSELKTEEIDLSLVIVGDGPMRSELKTKASQLNISSKVHFVGRVPREEVPQYILGFDIGYSGQIRMQIGRMYHSPLKLYEYMAMAKPVVASAFEDAQRLVDEGTTGFLFQSGNKDSLKQALKEAFYAKNRLANMGIQARREIEINHSWIARTRTIVEGVKQILEAKQQKA